MTSATKNNSITSFYLFSDYDVTRSTPPYFIIDYDVILFLWCQPYCDVFVSLCPCSKKVTLVFLHYDVILFDDVKSLGYCHVTVSLCPCRRSLCFLLLTCFITKQNTVNTPFYPTILNSRPLFL